MWALILMKEGIIIMNNKHNPMKNFYSIKNNESISFDAEDALSLVFASCLNHDCEVSKCTSFNYFRDLKLRILYAEIKKIINCMDKGDYDLSQLVDDHILRSAFAGSVFMKDGMGASYLVEAVIVCKQLLARQNVIIAGEIYRQVGSNFMYLLRLWKRLFDTLQKNYGWFVKIKLNVLLFIILCFLV